MTASASTETAANVCFLLSRASHALTTELAADGLAVMWVTHDLAQAHRVASRIVVMADGQLATDREAAEFVERERRRNQKGGSDARD